ncbi:hypothetical protein GJAV_G00142420 [Gymnothorax javanicus]|nr:hypothetical protein GJAV_G00142420 [Gymnothorax javanicus]
MGSLEQATLILGLCSLLTGAWGGYILGTPKLEVSDNFLVGKLEEFSCVVPDAPKTGAILYELYQENNPKVLNKSTAYAGNAGIFLLKAQKEHDGNFFCKASVQNDLTVPPTVSDIRSVRVIEPVEGAEFVSDPPLDEVFEGRGLNLTCTVRNGTYVSFYWSHNGTRWVSGNQVQVTQAAPEHAGNYSCLATNKLNDTEVYMTNSHVFIRVKVPVSEPRISFTVLKQQDVYLANITCQSEKGTPPVNFSFTHRNSSDEEQFAVREDSLSASFVVHIDLNRNEGDVRCQVDNGDLPVESDVLTLRVVPVGGDVTLTTQHVRSLLKVVGLALHCKVERGTFPRFHWLLNDTYLDARGEFYSIGGNGQTLLLKSVTARSSGFYHCVVTDSFDETNTLSSEKLFIDEKAVQQVSAVVLGVVLGCFLLLLCLIIGCCLNGCIYRRKLSPLKPRPPSISTETDELDSEKEEPAEDEYTEDIDLIEAAHMDYTDKSEEESVDEWSEIERALQISCIDE